MRGLCCVWSAYSCNRAASLSVLMFLVNKSWCTLVITRKAHVLEPGRQSSKQKIVWSCFRSCFPFRFVPAFSVFQLPKNNWRPLVNDGTKTVSIYYFKYTELITFITLIKVGLIQIKSSFTLLSLILAIKPEFLKMECLLLACTIMEETSVKAGAIYYKRLKMCSHSNFTNKAISYLFSYFAALKISREF